MRIRCKTCKGSNIIESSQTCPDCAGAGSDQIIIGVGESKGKNCASCKGKGKLTSKTKCENCRNGYIYLCDLCGNEIEGEDSKLCATCDENPIVIQLIQPLDARYLDGKRALFGTIEDVSQRQILIDLGCGFSGYFNPHDRRYNIGHDVVVRLRNPIIKSDRGGSPVSVIPLQITRYKIVKKHLPVDKMTISEISQKTGTVGELFCQITDIYQLKNGPTLFTMTDTVGKKIQGSAFGDRNTSAFPTITRGTIANIVARFKYINEKERLQIYSIEKVPGYEAFDFIDRLSGINQSTGEKIDELDFYVESVIYEPLKPSFVKAAKRIRSAILRHQNIILRYHSPCVDGITGAFAIDYAIRRYLENRGVKKEEFRRFIRRIPQRNPIFEIRELARDLSFALDEGANYKNLPLYVLVDVGSTEESIPALEVCKSYNVEVIVVDHHSISDSIEEMVHALINPLKIDEKSMITTGMVAVELAKFISAEQSIDNKTIQLAAISGYSDDVEGLEFKNYLELSDAIEFDKNWIDNVSSAIDYLIFGLRHFDGGEVVRNILGISGPKAKNTELIESITPTAKSLFTRALKVILNACEEKTLSNDVKLITLDMDNFTPRYDYPANSTLLAALHKNKVEEEGGSVITLGISNDYIIMRSSALDFNFKDFLTKIQESHLHLGIRGYGHRNTGIIQFYSGHKDVVIEEIDKLISS